MAFTTLNPTTGKVEATIAEHTTEEVEARLEAAAWTFGSYRETTFEQRAEWMRAAADLYDAEQPDIARILTTEMGKTFASAKAEVAKCALCMRFFADRAESFLADEEVESSAGRSFIRYQPLGPVLAVMPWNFPLWQVVRFVAPALMAGNVGLLKHASNVPQSALLLEDVFRRAGFPDGAFSTLLVPSGRVAELIGDDRVRAVTLTGSEAAGQSVAATAGQALKKCVLELGGSDPFVVTASADIDKAVKVGVTARVQNNGQSCIAAKRFVVVDEVADRFVSAFVDRMAGLVVGDPFDPKTDVGPLVSEVQRDEVRAQVDDAREHGAEVACGGEVVPGEGWFYRPTVLIGVKPGMRAYDEEVFGPVAVVEQVDDLDEAIAVANRTTFGLGASVWAEDAEEQRRCIHGIEAGMVFVNAMVSSTPELPFGGIKRSGYGRELSELGIKEFCNAKAVWGGLSAVTGRADPPVAYLDHAATSPVRPEVIEAMAPYLAETFANASASYGPARRARRAVEEAREEVAACLGASPPEVVFTSGGTEADNLAIMGTLAVRTRPGEAHRAVCTAIEHAAVLEPMRAAARGAAAVYGIGALQLCEVGVSRDGVVDLELLGDALDETTALVSVMAANNEIGTIQPLAEVRGLVGRLAPGAVLHTDAVQAAPYLDLAAATARWDLVSVSAHKLGGPKGAGALVARGPVRLAPLLRGGGQEHERRSGTLDVAGIVGLATALGLAATSRTREWERLAELRDRLADALCYELAGTVESAPRAGVLPGHLHLRFDGVEQEELLVLLDRQGVYASAGSACASGAVEPSHVLLAMGVSAAEARTGIRFSLGYTTTQYEVDRAIEVVHDAVGMLRA